MNKIIPFTKFRFIMFVVSICLLVGFGAGTYLQNGFNSGIDFAGGWNIQVQFAPVAFTIDYTGEKVYEITILDNKLTLYDVLGDIKKQAGEPLNFNNYNTIADLALELERIVPGISVSITDRYRDVSPLKIISKDKNLPLNANEGILVHVPVQTSDESFTSIDSVREALSPLGNISVQSIGDNPLAQMYILKAKEDDLISSENTNSDDSSETNRVEEVEGRIKEYLANKFESRTILIKKSEFVGPSFSQELRLGALGSVIVAIVLILVYITIRFKIGYALAAITALIHDVFIMIGVIGTLQLELTSATLAAVLTIIGYSLNDTIVVFDRIRENSSLLRDQDREMIINTSITQSLSRTLITSLTTLLAVVSIYIFSTGVIKDFAFNLIIGIVVGTYSSIFIASPILLGWQNAASQRKKAKQEAANAAVIKKKSSVKVQNEPTKTQKTVEPTTSNDSENTEENIEQDTLQKKTRKKKKKKKKK
ncbi:MAG: protein translocase subunit SecF [Spirochaetales bacterium]|nr:protein translocase subunit SecF [Spirochaetales bacterium]